MNVKRFVRRNWVAILVVTIIAVVTYNYMYREGFQGTGAGTATGAPPSVAAPVPGGAAGGAVRYQNCPSNYPTANTGGTCMTTATYTVSQGCPTPSGAHSGNPRRHSSGKCEVDRRRA